MTVRTRFEVGQGPHLCEPRFSDMGRGLEHPECMYCGNRMLRLVHEPGHRIAGKVCRWPDSWKRCYVAQVALPPADPFLLADWRQA